MECSNHDILINNFKSNETVHYPLVIIKGVINNNNTASPCYDEKIDLEINSLKTHFNVVDCKFKVLAELKRGQNSINLKYCCSTIIIILVYVPRQTPLSVLPLYIICQGHDGSFQAPATQKNDTESAIKRISLGAKLLQSVIADKLFEENQERKTFRLENECQVFYSQLNYADARKMTQGELWETLGREIIASESLKHERIKFLGFLSCTWYRGEKYQENFTHDEIVKITEGYVALGGGGLALFNTACLYTWPENWFEVLQSFENHTSIKRTEFMDDSCYRGSFGACFSTTLGAVLHELCHTFDLGHTDRGIMGRGFDNINKVFIVNKKKSNTDIWNRHQNSVEFEESLGREPRSRRSEKKKISSTKNLSRENDEDETFWTASCLTILAHHKWTNNHPVSENKIKFDHITNFVRSTAGLRVIEIRNEEDGMVLFNWMFGSKILKYSFQLPEENMQTLFQNYVIFVEDDVGNIFKRVVDK